MSLPQAQAPLGSSKKGIGKSLMLKRNSVLLIVALPASCFQVKSSE
jgi:hypothetical protein